MLYIMQNICEAVIHFCHSGYFYADRMLLYPSVLTAATEHNC